MNLQNEPRSDLPVGFDYQTWISLKHKCHFDSKYNDFIKNKRIIIVGPSPSLIGTSSGQKIDDYDIVVRLNKGFPVDNDITIDVGSKTTIHYHCLCLANVGGCGEIHYNKMKSQSIYLASPYPKYVKPFYNDVINFERSNQKWKLPFHCMGDDYYLGVATMLGTRPNTGILAILDILCGDISELYITGFTFFQDGWRNGYTGLHDMFGDELGTLKETHLINSECDGNHKQIPQMDLVRSIYLHDNRVNMDDNMKAILKI